MIESFQTARKSLQSCHTSLSLGVTDSVCGAWPMSLRLSRSGDAVLRLYKGRDDLLWNFACRPDEGPCSTYLSNILCSGFGYYDRRFTHLPIWIWSVNNLN
ncbi:unnamed protein product [Natator depressus]